MNYKVFSDCGKEIIPNSQLEKSMAEVAVVNALIVRKGDDIGGSHIRVCHLVIA